MMRNDWHAEVIRIGRDNPINTLFKLFFLNQLCAQVWRGRGGQ